ncbi:MAG: ABC transporter ATP-binding protein [Rhodothermales bacterium]|nr:ABC transporter ATP-binding protein [Rhodothermales bacterium]
MRPLAHLNKFYWKYRWLFIPGLLCAVGSAIFSLMVPMIVRQAVDNIPIFVRVYAPLSDSSVAESLHGSFFTTLLLYGLIIISLSLFSGVFSFLMRQTIVVASRHIEYDLRNRLYDHIQGMSRRFYIDNSTGDIITRATSDIEQVRRYIGPAIMYLTRALVIVVTAITVMFIISPRLTLFAIIPMPFLAVAVFFVAHLVHKRSDELQKQYSSLTTLVQEALSGIRVVKAYTREEHEAKSFSRESDEYRRRMLDLAAVEAAFRPVFILLIGMSTIIVVWVGGRLAMEGAISIGNIAEYIIYVALMTWPVAAVGFVITMVQRASASMSRLQEILDSEPDVTDGSQTDTSIDRVDGRIRFSDVNFSYKDGQNVLSDIRFELDAGQMLAIVGRTGAGKSTLVSLIPRLMDPTGGTVYIGGKDARTIPIAVLRKAIGYVPQEVFLFNESIDNNIRFGDIEATESTVEAAARNAVLFDNIMELPEKFETMVGERGVTVSGGQKQRTSIARALVRAPEILIFDDALSAVDTDTERRILRNLKTQQGERTLVIVSHRISAVQDADLILVLDDGNVVQRGTHDDLVREEGLYANLYRQQQLEEEIEAIA